MEDHRPVGFCARVWNRIWVVLASKQWKFNLLGKISRPNVISTCFNSMNLYWLMETHTTSHVQRAERYSVEH